MSPKQEVIKIQLEKQKVTKNSSSPKIAQRIKSEKLDIFIVCGTTDLRKGIDGLDTIVQHDYNLEIYQNALFLFYGDRND